MDGGYTNDGLPILKKSTDQTADGLPIFKKKSPSGSDGSSSSTSSDSGLNPFQSSLVNGIPVDRPISAPFVSQSDKDAAVADANNRQQTAQDKLSNRLKEIKSYLDPERAKHLDNALQVASVQEPDGIREVTPEEQAHYAFMQTPLGKVLGSAAYLSSKATKGALQVAKGLAHYSNVALNSNPGLQAVNNVANDITFDTLDKNTNFGLTKGDQANFDENKVVGNLGGLAEFAPAAATAELSGGATLFLQGAGQAQEELDKAEKDSDVKVDPLVREAFIGGTGIVNKFLMHDLSGVFSKLPAGLRGDITASISANAIKEASGKELTGDTFNSIMEAVAKDFSDKVLKFGYSAINSTAKAGVDLSALAASNFLLKKGVDVTSDQPVFHEDAGDLAQAISDIVVKQAPFFGLAGTAGELSKLTPYSNYKNSVVESLIHDRSEDNVAKIKQDIVDHNNAQDPSRQWSREEMDATLANVDRLAQSINKVPAGVPVDKMGNALDLVNGRDELQANLNAIRKAKADGDPANSGVHTDIEDLISNKIDQAGDKLYDLQNGYKTTYEKDDSGPYKKTTFANKAKALIDRDPIYEGISQSRYDLEHTENPLPHEEVVRRAQQQVESLTSKVDEIQQSPDGSNPITNPEGTNELIETLQKRTDIQSALLDDASNPDPVVDNSISDAHNAVSSDVKTALEAGRKKQVVVVDENGNQSVQEQDFNREDANDELDYLGELAKRGKLTIQKFQSSFFGQAIPSNIFHDVVGEIDKDQVGFIDRLKKSFNEAGNEAKTGTEIAADASGVLPGSNEGDRIEQVAGGSLPGDGSEPAAVEGDNNSSDEGVFQYKSKEFNPVNITPGADGEFNVKFDDGTTMSLPKEDIKSLFGFDTDKLDAPEQEARLHSTDDPEEVARMYDDKVKELQDTGSVEGAIAAYGPRTNADEFGRINDPNNVTNGIRLNYFRNAPGDADLNNQAEEINRQSFNGDEKVTAHDIAEFMIKYPGGAESYSTAAGNPELKAISDRYAELTNKDISNKFAKSLAREYGNVSVGDIRNAQNEFEGLANEDKVNKFIDDQLSDQSLNTPEHVMENMRDQFDKYVEDPSNMFNIFHDVFNGEALTVEEVTTLKSILDEKNNEQVGGSSNDQEHPGQNESGPNVDAEQEISSGESGESAKLSFKTSRGSVYDVNSDGTTVRNKAERSDPGHEGDFGLKESSVKTVYLTPEQMGVLGEVQTEGPYRKRIKGLGDGRVGVMYIDGPDAGNFEKRTIVTPNDQPAIGLHPLEIFSDGKEHFGNEITEVNDSVKDDLPFQIGEGDTISKEKARAVQGLLEQAFPNVETKFHTDVPSFERAAKKAGIDTEGRELPNAFVDGKNVIHFNPERLNADTQVHEYGHILTRWARENAPQIWDKLIRIGNEAAGVRAELRQNGYNLDQSRMAEEAFVTLLGRDGEGKLDAAIKNSGTRGTVSKFINDAWIKFQRYVLEKTGYDISKFKNIKNMSMHEFLDTINSKYLLSEVKVGDIGSKEFTDNAVEQKTRPLRQTGETSSEYAKRVLDWIKEKQAAGDDISFANLKTNLAPVRETIAKANRDFNAGFKAAQLEQKAAFLEYDKYKKEVAAERLQKERDLTKEKFGEYTRDQADRQNKKLKELKDKYNDKLAKEKELRQEQTKKLKDSFNNIRKEIKDIIVGLNKSGAFGKIKFSDKQLLGFANQLNSVKTERGLDRFRDFVARASKDAEVIRDVQDARSGIKDAKQLLKAKFVPQNIKDAIKDIVTINPYDAKDVKRFNRILDDINNGQRMKEFSEVPMQEVHDFINEEKDHNLNTRADDIIQNHNGIYYGEDLFNYKQTQTSTLPDRSEIASQVSRVLRDPDTTYNEKVKKLNNINDALDIFDQSLKDSFSKDPNGKMVADTPTEDFHKILDTINDKPNELSESLRDSLENIASAKQDLIDIDPSMSPEQKESLKILKEVPLAGQDADTLRLFNNVLENVVNNDDHSGIGKLEAIAVGNGDEGALKLPNYLEATGRKVRDARLNAIGRFRAIGANLSVIMTRIANNDFEFLAKLNTGTHFDEIRNGFAQAKHQYDELIGKKIEAVFKEHPTIAKSPESIQRLSLFSYINQNREFSSPEQQNAELIRRFDIIKRDIELKAAEGLKNDNSEAAIERDIWQGFSDKIKDATGIDVADEEQLRNLTYSQIRQLEFLEPGERAVYDVYRAADDELRPAHQDVVKRQLNMPYEAWDNHMRDGYRFLGTGLVDVVSGEGLGFTAAEQNTTNGSVATLQRVKGDPLAAKSGEKQKVLNLNFFDVQNQNIKDQLNDIHTLKNRQIFDEALKNRTLRDVLGNENHQLYKETVRNNVLNEMGLNNSVGEKELRLMKQGLNIITKLGTFKQLLSYSALVKQASATIFNTLTNIGGDAKLMHDAARVLNTDEVKALIKKHPISERGDNMASLNTLRDEALADKDNTVKGSDERGVIKKMFDHTETLINKYFLQLNPDGTSGERNIAKPIQYGDVKTGEWAWVTYYADHIIKNGGAVDFKGIDWAKEAETPNREAADYAENMTAKQLNENTKSARSKLINSNSAVYMGFKTLLFPFGSFNMHKFQTLVENFRTIASKDTFVDADYRKNQAGVAAKSLMSALVEETFFQGIKLSIGYGLTAFVTKGIAYGLTSIFGDDKEKKDVLDKIDIKLQQKRDNFLQQWYTNTLGNYFFGGLGNGPQDVAQRSINDLTNSNFFYEPNLSLGQKFQEANNYGMFGAAFNGMGDVSVDAYRIFDNTDKYHVPVNITPYQKSVIASSMLSNMLAFAGLNDADLNRSVDALRKQVEYGLASKFHEPNYRDLSQPTPLKIYDKVIELSQEHQDYYEQMKEPKQQELEKNGYASKRAAAIAAIYAKQKLAEKFGYPTIIKDGNEIKKKK